jgi:hypothetical protein
MILDELTVTAPARLKISSASGTSLASALVAMPIAIPFSPRTQAHFRKH